MQERKRLDVTVVYLHQAFISFVVLYKRGFVMFGVVSLTMGNSPFPLAYRFVRYIKLLRQLPLGHAFLLAQLEKKSAKFLIINFVHHWHLLACIILLWTLHGNRPAVESLIPRGLAAIENVGAPFRRRSESIGKWRSRICRTFRAAIFRKK